VPVYPSDLGTKSGLVTDDGGRVLNDADQPIPACTRPATPPQPRWVARIRAPGVTIAEAMTSGFLAAEAIAADAGQHTA